MEALFVLLARKVAQLRHGEKVKKSKCSTPMPCKTWRPMMAEFLGTMILVVLGCGVAITTKSAEEGTLKIALAFGLGATAAVQMVGHISGAHINPAVTVAAVFSLDISVMKGFCYVIAQCAGGIAGAAILLGVVPSSSFTTLGSNAPGPGVTVWQAFGVEFILTYILVFANAAISDDNIHVAGHTSLPVGLVIAGLHLLGIPLTGCGINPARSLGPALISGTWTHHWVFWAGPLGGAVLAGLSYKYLLNPYRGLPSVEEALERAVNSDPLLGQFRVPEPPTRQSAPRKPASCRGARSLWERPDYLADISTVFSPGPDYEIIPHLSQVNRV